MKLKDVFRLVFNSMKYKRLRTVLTILGIMIGPAAIVALLSITSGYGAAITSQLSKIGVTTIYVSAGRSLNLTPAVVAKLGTLPNVTAVLPYYSFSGTVSGNSNESVTVYAIDTSQLSSVVPSLELGQGAVPTGTSAGTAIGYSIAYPNTTDESNISVGKILSIVMSKGSSYGSFLVISESGFSSKSFGSSSSRSSTSTHSFFVTGTYNQFGQGFFMNPDTSIFIPLAEGKVLAQSSNYTGVFVEAKNATAVTSVVTELQGELGSNARVTSVSSILDSIKSIEASASTLLIAIAGISFVVAFMSIMTTMFTSVTERTREIGVLKALGFTSRQVLILFVCESLVIGFIGGTVGASAGAAVGYFGAPYFTSSFGSGGVGASPARTTSGSGVSFRSGSGAASSSPSRTVGASAPKPAAYVSPTLIIEVILLTSGMGAIAGLLPAWRASRLVPAEALRAL